MGEEQNIADKTDCSVALAIGALTSTLDVLWHDTNLLETAKWDNQKLQNYVEQITKVLQPKIKSQADAVTYLQHDNIAPVQKIESAFSGAVKKKAYNLANQGNVLGLACSILSQFTEKKLGMDEDGNFHIEQLAKEELAGTPVEKFYNATISWIVHMTCGIADRNNPHAIKRGDAVPAPLTLLLQEAAQIPGLSEKLNIDENGDYRLATLMTNLLEGKYAREHEGENAFDLSRVSRTPEALGKQMVPVILDECIVRAFYAFRRFTAEVKQLEELSWENVKNIDQTKYMPFNSDALTHMLMLSNISFSSVDLAASVTKALAKNKGQGDAKVAVADFLKEVNYAGLIRLTMNASVELGPNLEQWTQSCQEQINKCKDAIAAGVEAHAEEVSLVEKASGNAQQVLGMAEAASPVGVVTVLSQVYEEIKVAEEERAEARAERIQIEEACNMSIRALEEYQQEFISNVSDYLEQHITVFNAAVQTMDQAIAEDDADKFIGANTQIQQQLGYDTQFTTTEEFDELMGSDDALKL